VYVIFSACSEAFTTKRRLYPRKNDQTLMFKDILFPVHDPKSIGSKEPALSPHNFLEVYVLKSLMCSPNGRGV
jgi:hypothetical protein